MSGYLLLASLTSLFSTSTTIYSILMRGLIATTSIFLIFKAKKNNFSPLKSLLIKGFLFFWFIYFSRILFETFFNKDLLSQPPYYYWLWGAGTSFLPFFAISITLQNEQTIDKIRQLLYHCYFAASIFSILGGSTSAINQTTNIFEETGRLRLDSIDPISLGNLGATLSILSIWSILHIKNLHFIKKYLYFTLGLSAGLYLLLSSNSRGPLVSFGVCLLFISIFSNGRIKIFSTLLLITATIGLPYITLFLEKNYNIMTYSRLFNQIQSEDASTQARIQMHQNAIEGISSNPLFGYGLEEYIGKFHPHNIFLESFIATGLLGGTFFIFISIYLLYISIKIYRNNRTLGWASLLFIQYLVGAQFSGSLVNSSYFWISSGLIISINHISKFKNMKFNPNNSYINRYTY